MIHSKAGRADEAD
jgi:hypothetical protein